MGNIQDFIVFFNIFLQLIYHFVICHGPPQPEIPSPVQCYGRCLAKCTEENSEISLNQCRKNCRKYGQQGLCVRKFLKILILEKFLKFLEIKNFFWNLEKIFEKFKFLNFQQI